MSILIKAISLSVIMIMISACGNSNGGNSNTITIKGVAIDGYIKNATVILDINLNGTYDADEPLTTTNDKGEFSFDSSVIGEYPVIVSGGVDTATNEDFDGILKNIVELKKDEKNVDTKVTPLTTISTNILEEERKTNSGYTKIEAQQITADNLGLSLEQIEEDPLKNKAVFSKTQEIMQTTKVFARSIQGDDEDKESQKEAFKYVFTKVSKSIHKDGTSKAFNVEKVATELESSSYKGHGVSIVKDVKDFAITHTQEIKDRVKETNIEALPSIQNDFKKNTDEANTKIKNHQTGTLKDISNRFGHNKNNPGGNGSSPVGGTGSPGNGGSLPSGGVTGSPSGSTGSPSGGSSGGGGGGGRR